MNRRARRHLATAAVLLAACGSNAGQLTPNGAVDEPVTITATSFNRSGAPVGTSS